MLFTRILRRMLLVLPAMLVTLPAMSADKLTVVASFSILGDIVQQVGKDRITVSTLVRPDQDAHVFQATPEDMRVVSKANLVVVNGLGFDGWMDRLVKTAGYRGNVVVASAGIQAMKNEEDDDEHEHNHGHKHEHEHEHEHHHHGEFDPHAWQDPRNVLVYVRNIAEALSRLDPQGKDIYQKNAAAYAAQLTELDQWAQKVFAGIPAAQRRVITSHDAFGYFAKRYQVEFLSVQGMSTESQPSARDVASLIREIRKQKVRAIFMENMSSPRVVEQISRETGIALGGKLYTDALSGPKGDAPDYLSMMRYNVRTLVQQMK